MRDHFIMVLSPHFDSVTGETFNKAGKTDILIRYEEMNAFVAECKYWRGSKQHSETIDQVLSYLTWRDSKAAILYFVKSKNLDPVLKQILRKRRNIPHSSSTWACRPRDGMTIASIFSKTIPGMCILQSFAFISLRNRNGPRLRAGGRGASSSGIDKAARRSSGNAMVLTSGTAPDSAEIHVPHSGLRTGA